MSCSMFVQQVAADKLQSQIKPFSELRPIKCKHIYKVTIHPDEPLCFFFLQVPLQPKPRKSHGGVHSRKEIRAPVLVYGP